MSKRTALLILILIVIAGVGIRSYGLTARSLWFDEAFSWRLIQFPFTAMIARAAADVHPPLYYILLQGWSFFFATSILSIRAFSVTLAAATLLAAYLFTATAMRSRSLGLFAAALLAVSGFQIQYAWEARMYTLGTALALLSSWLLIKAIRQKPQRLPYWIGYGVVTAAFAYVHYFSFFTIAAQVIFLLGLIIIHTRGRLGEILQWRLTWYAAVSGLIMALIYLPWLSTFIKQNSQVQESYWVPPIGGWSIPDTFYRMLAPTSGIPNHLGIAWILLALTPIAFIILTWVLLITLPALRRRHADAVWLIMCSASVPFIISILMSFLGQSLYQDRFLVFAHLFIVIGLAIVIYQIKVVKLRWAVIAVTLIASLAAYGAYWNELDIQNKPGVRAAVRQIFTRRQSGEAVLVTSPFVFFGVDHYAAEEYGAGAGDSPDPSAIPRLYSESGQLAHFAGGPILRQDDVAGPEIFNANQTLWVVDTTGFGSSALTLPDNWQAIDHQTYPEVFSYQADVFVTKYLKR